MENYKKYLIQNSELILRKVTESKNPLSFLNDVNSLSSSEAGILKYEVVMKGVKTEDGKFEVGDIVLCRKDILRTILHDDFEGLVAIDEKAIFCKVSK